MTKEEAILTMESGERITHHYFTPDEWMTIKSDGFIHLEDGVSCPQNVFWQWRKADGWNDGYSVFNQ